KVIAGSDDEFEKMASINQLKDAYLQYLAKRGMKREASKPMPAEIEEMVIKAEYQQYKNSRQLFPLKKKDEENDTYQREYLR
ncbi:MAG: hypothetical protein LBI54_07960, partial [Lachnospiraceae bacterium]|nr:hypothetical protein [Lachnospiraceae bacterium]